MLQEVLGAMLRRYETVDSKGDFQGQDLELRGILRAIYEGGSGGIILPSREPPPR
jgi:hypothetical protein